MLPLLLQSTIDLGIKMSLKPFLYESSKDIAHKALEMLTILLLHKED